MHKGQVISGIVALAVAGGGIFAQPAAATAEEVARAAQCSGVDPILLYGPEADFEVRRDETPIGRHRITFTRRDGRLVVDAEFRIAITVLGFTVYSYEYRSEEIWRDGCLRSVQADIDDNGERWSMTARGQDGVLKVTGPADSYTVDRRVFPTNHWNAEVIRSSAVLNTLTGKVNNVAIERVGTETVPTGTGPRRATHYRFTGELHTEVWYDDAGRWVKLRFPSKDGSTIDYVCRRCGPPVSAATTRERNG